MCRSRSDPEREPQRGPFPRAYQTHPATRLRGCHAGTGTCHVRLEIRAWEVVGPAVQPGRRSVSTWLGRGARGYHRVVEWITVLMAALGAVGAGLAVALENVFPPVPSELVLPLAGFTAAQGKISLWA